MSPPQSTLSTVPSSSASMASLRFPFRVESPLLLRRASNLDLRVQFDGKGATDELHPLTERIEFAGEDCVTHAKVIEGIGDTTSIARRTEASDAFKISNR